GLGAIDLDAELVAPLAALLDIDVAEDAWVSLDSQQRARRMLNALRRLIVRESALRPVVIVLEDLHWIDADTQIALDRLIDVVPAARILFAVAYRPEYRHTWAGKPFYTQLRIDPLPAPAADLLLDDLLGTAPPIEPVKAQLLTWTERNPFFLEEGVRTMVETGEIVGVPGAYRPSGKVVASALPATVEATLAARIHRLPADARHVLQSAAVLGIEFAHAILTSLTGHRREVLAEHLRALERAEFVYPVASPSLSAHTFKHALTHLVAYRSLPPERQRALHAEALAALEASPGGQLDVHVDALAEHAFRAEAWDAASRYLHAAGTRALTRTTTRTAVDHLERAIVALDRAEPRREIRDRGIDVRLDLRYALTIL